MKKNYLKTLCLLFASLLFAPAASFAQSQPLVMNEPVRVGMVPPIPVALEGFSGEALEVLKFDLYVQGFCFVPPDAATYLIKSAGGAGVGGTVTDKTGHSTYFSKVYNGATVRLQAHSFADGVVGAIHNPAISGEVDQSYKPIGCTKIAYKSQATGFGAGEVFMADFDGHGAQSVTSDGAIVARPAWVPGRMALYYTSYARSNPDIFYHSLSSGQRSVVAGYSGLNTSAAVSRDGSRVAMILSKSGSPNVWVSDANGSNPRRITKGIEDSSPCWSPDSKWICFATKSHDRRRLAKVPAEGGEVQNFNTVGVSNPTEPDWSPDGKWIAFTSQAGKYFNICVMPADGSTTPVVLVSGQNPSWAPNSRTLVFNHGPDGQQKVAVLDAFTKQFRDCQRPAGSSSEPAWAR
jgi:TolB protein